MSKTSQVIKSYDDFGTPIYESRAVTNTDKSRTVITEDSNGDGSIDKVTVSQDTNMDGVIDGTVTSSINTANIGPTTNTLTPTTASNALAGQDASLIDLSAGTGDANNLTAGLQLTGDLSGLSPAFKAEISRIASEGQNTWTQEARDAYLANNAYTPGVGVASLANSIGLLAGTGNTANITANATNAGITQTLLEDAGNQSAAQDSWQWANADFRIESLD